MGRVDAAHDDLAAGHRRGHGKGARLQPIAEDAVLDPVQPVHPLDLEPMRSRPLDLRAHGLQHRHQVVDLRLLGGVLDDGVPRARVAASIAFSVPITVT